MKICPKCGSENIKRESGNWLSAIGLDRSYECSECGYSGRFFLEIDEDKLEEAKETIENNDLPDLEEEAEKRFNKGKFAFGLIFLIMGVPLLVHMPLGGNFIIGVVSSFIGIALLHSELKKIGI